MKRIIKVENLKLKKILCLICVVLMATSSVTPAFAATKAELQKQKKEAESKLSSAKEKAKDIEGEVEEAEEQVNIVDQQLIELLAAEDILKDELMAKEEQIEATSADLEVAKADEEKQYLAMKRRIRFMYEQGDTNYIELIMTSESIADAINKADFAEKVYDYDRKLLEDFQAVKKQVADLLEQLQNEKAELEGLQLEQQEQQAELEELLKEKKAIVNNFEEQLSKARAEAKNYENQIKKANTEIAKIAAAEEAARKKAAEEAKRKAAEEAKRKAAEAAAAAEAEKNNNDSVDASQEGTYDEPKSTVTASGSGAGSDIANYALQFVGNPYVAGGTSLTNGTDCSGFTMSVYSHFGYKIPRTSSQQAGYGTSVSYSDAQPGDIMCYAGHVGIYIGNGMIVHASTPATGIKTTIATYRPILSVRRIVR